jgi:uncharacterized protein YoxC
MKIIMLLLIITLVPFFAFSQTSDCEEALEESDKLLEEASKRISELGKENEELKAKVAKLKEIISSDCDSLLKENEKLKNEIEKLESELKSKNNTIEDLKTTVKEADEAIAASNQLLEKAYDRINEDQKEIIDLRTSIKQLINSGVEIQTHHYNVALTAGYPANAGFQFAYNFHFFPKLGVIAGFDFNFEKMEPSIYGGIKINIE